MKLQIITDCSNIDWQIIADSLKEVGMAYHEPEVHKRAFEASHTSVFVYEDSQLLGFGRVISDGEYQGAIYDVAVLPEAQGKGIGKKLLNFIKEKRSTIQLKVYKKNTKTVEFYKRQDFNILSENKEEATGEFEFLMEWKNIKENNSD